MHLCECERPIFKNWPGKAGKPVLFSDREAGKA